MGEGYASGETKAQRCSAPWHVCFPNQGSEQQVRPGEQVTSKTELTLCPGHIAVTGCLLGRWGRGGRQAGGHPRSPSLRNGTCPCTCTHVPHASMHSPPLSLWEKAWFPPPLRPQPEGRKRSRGGGGCGGPRPRQASPRAPDPAASRVPPGPTLGPTFCQRASEEGRGEWKCLVSDLRAWVAKAWGAVMWRGCMGPSKEEGLGVPLPPRALAQQPGWSQLCPPSFE